MVCVVVSSPFGRPRLARRHREADAAGRGVDLQEADAEPPRVVEVALGEADADEGLGHPLAGGPGEPEPRWPQRRRGRTRSGGGGGGGSFASGETVKRPQGGDPSRGTAPSGCSSSIAAAIAAMSGFVMSITFVMGKSIAVPRQAQRTALLSSRTRSTPAAGRRPSRRGSRGSWPSATGLEGGDDQEERAKAVMQRGSPPPAGVGSMPLPRLRGGDRRGWQRRRRCPRRRRRAARRGSSRRRRSRSACRGLRRCAEGAGRSAWSSDGRVGVCLCGRGAAGGRGKNDARQRQSGRESTRFFRTVELLGVPSCSAEASCSPSGGSSAPPAWSVGRVEGPRGRSSSAAGSGRVACARRRLSTASEPPSRWRHRVKIVRWPPESFFRCSVRAGRFTSAHRERCVLRHTRFTSAHRKRCLLRETSRTFHVSASLRDQQHCFSNASLLSVGARLAAARRRCPVMGARVPG